MKPHLTIRGLHELGPLLDDTDPDHTPVTIPITHVISLWDPPKQDETRREIDEQLDQFARHLPDAPVLPLYFDDIPRPVEGFTAPSTEHMRQVLDFAREAVADHEDATHILVHCQMGFSRSPACALAVLAATNPESPSDTLLAQILRVRPWIAPNPRLTRFADEILERDDPLLPAVTAHRAEMMGT